MSKIKDDIIRSYLTKKKLLNKHNKLYHDKDSPIIADQKYDDLKKKIIELEKSNSFLKTHGSVNDVIGFKPSPKFEKIKHAKPMLSLSNAFNASDIKDFIKKIINYLNNKTNTTDNCRERYTKNS